MVPERLLMSIDLQLEGTVCIPVGACKVAIYTDVQISRSLGQWKPWNGENAYIHRPDLDISSIYWRLCAALGPGKWGTG